MCTVRIALLSALALASAEILLAPQDVPMECATICGPMVELTNKCSLGSSDTDPEVETVARVKRRKVERQSRGHAHFHDKRRRRKRTVVTNALGQVVSVPSGLGKGQAFTVTTVVTVTAAPGPVEQPGATTPPADAASPTWSVMTTTMTMVAAEEGEAGGDLSLPTDDAVAPTSTPLVVGNVADEDDAFAETEDAGDAVVGAERECVCQNDSFDVELVSGLCSSCIWQSGSSLGSRWSPPPFPTHSPVLGNAVQGLQANAEQPWRAS